MEATRSATTIWKGDLMSGTGQVTADTTGLFRDLPVSWASRTEQPAGRTSPEELLAAAHAACFSMSFSGRLAKAGHTAEELRTTAEVTFEKQTEGWKVKRSHITVRGRVPGADAATFAEAAEGAKENCPISQALKGNVELSVDASLEA